MPNYYEAGLVADGDPALAFGPKPGTDGTFSWDNGSRLYYGNLTSNFPTGVAFKGFEAIAVSHADDLTAAAAGTNSAWSSPVIVSKQNSALFSDKDALWADNAATSPYFGHVYMCNVAFRSVGYGGAPEPVIFALSTDGGDTWSTRQISSAANTGLGQGRQGCAIRTDSQGTIYVFYESAAHKKSTPPVFDQAILMTRSTNGGRTFSPPVVVAPVTECGKYEPALGDVFFDGVAGARTDSFPSVDIANGAPSGADATNTIAVTWCDASNGLNHEQALVTLSTDGGSTWSSPVNAAESSDRPDFPSIAISPNGDDLYLTYMGFKTDYQSSTADPRMMQGVVRYASTSDPSSWSTLHRGLAGDARASSANSLTAEFLGDYTYVAATNSGAVAVWTDVSNAIDCPAVDTYRQSLVDGAPIARPAPATDCGVNNTFGNSDIASFTATKP
ncbi:MAG: sialidase family protein [Deinococcales bacterium]